MIWGIRGNGRNIYSIYSNIILNHDCKRKETWRDITRDYSQERSNVEIWCSKFWWLECKSRKSRNTWSNRQIWPWSTEKSRAKANRVLPRELNGHSKHSLPTTQEKTPHMDVTRWSILKSDGLHFLQPKVGKLYIVSKKKKKKKTRDQELTVAEIMNSLLQNSDLNWRK